MLLYYYLFFEFRAFNQIDFLFQFYPLKMKWYFSSYFVLIHFHFILGFFLVLLWNVWFFFNFTLESINVINALSFFIAFSTHSFIYIFCFCFGVFYQIEYFFFIFFLLLEMLFFLLVCFGFRFNLFSFNFRFLTWFLLQNIFFFLF